MGAENFTTHAYCTDVIDGLKTLASRSVSCVVTSPPYNIGKNYNTHNDNRADYLPWLQTVFSELKRTLKDEGHFFLQMGGIATDPLIPHEALNRALASGWVLQNQILWVKSVSVGGNSYGPFTPINSTRFLNHTYEFIFHLTITGKSPIDRIGVGVPFVDKSNIERFTHRRDVRCRGNVWYIPYEPITPAERVDRHPAVFPVALAEMCIRLSGVPKGSLIVDPFTGSGTTLVACDRLGMRGVGFDIDPLYVAQANARLRGMVPFVDVAGDPTAIDVDPQIDLPGNSVLGSWVTS